MRPRDRTASDGTTVLEIPECPKKNNQANTLNCVANQSKPRVLSLALQLLATTFAVMLLVSTLRGYTSIQRYPEFIWLFISCSATFYIVFYNALAMEQVFKQWLARHYPTLQGLSIVIAVMLATFPIGALYLVPLDIANPAPSVRTLNTRIAAAPSTSLGPKGEAVNVAQFHGRAAELAHPILVLSDVQYRSGLSATTVTIGVDENVQYEINRLTNPDRIYLDFRGSKIDGSLLKQRFQVTDPVLRAIRMAEHKGNVSRVTLETNRFCDYLLTTVAKSHKVQIELLNPAAGYSTPPPTLASPRLANDPEPSPTSLASSN